VGELRDGREIRVGLVGVGNWARYGHIPALQSLKAFRVTAVSSRTRAKVEELARTFDIPHAFDDARQLVEHEDVDLAVVLPPAPEHAALSRMAIDAGKDVYCEWPLTTTTTDSEELLSRATAAGVRHLTGLQRRMGASARYLRDLIGQGYLGQLRSVRMHVSIEYFGPKRPPSLEWTLPARNFSHVLSIYGGHFFDLLFSLVGQPKTVGAIVASQFPTLTLTRTGESFPNETPDAVLAQGGLINGALYSVQIEAGKRNNSGLQIDFTGTEGDLKVTNTKSFGNVSDNLIEGARGTGKRMETLPVPDQYQLLESAALDASVQDLAHLYATYRGESPTTAPTFHDAVRMHRYIDAIVWSSETGSTQEIDMQ
jgi:predicted dehydrogenase